MSESQIPADTQGLLQSMLQRLKLQPGRDGQSFPRTPGTSTAASTLSQGGDGEAPIHPVNGFDFGVNGGPSKLFGASAAHFKGGEVQQPRASGMDKGLTSVPSLKGNTDNDLDENRVSDKVTLPDIPPTETGTGQLFPAKSPKDHKTASFEETVGERVKTANSTTIRHISGDKHAVANIEQNQILGQETEQEFTPKLYTWSLKPTHADVDTGNGKNKVLHVGNGGTGTFNQRTDMQLVANSQTTKISSLRRNQQSSEKKTRRWTQKIKERWLDRPGSFGKKGKARFGNVDYKVEQGTESLPQKQEKTENLISSANREEGRILLLLDSSDPRETLPSLPEESTSEERVRTSSDFDLGLGSFSLLEEIVTGQEWAKFLDPNLTASSANRTPPEDPQSQTTSSPTSHDSGPSSLILNQQRDGGSQWSTGATKSSPAPEAQESLDAFQPVSMDVSEVKQRQEVHRTTDRSEPMEDEQPGQRGRRLHHRAPFSVEPSHTVVNSALKRVPLNRKRQHQSAESDERLHSEKTGVSSLTITQNHMTDETQHNFLMPLNTRNFTPTPTLSPSFKPFAPPPRSVLKQSMSLDSEASMETETKRRRVEENRRVRFSEEVLTIDPPELGDYATDSEEDSGADNDSVIEHEREEAQAGTEEAAAAAAAASPTSRRPALPAWIKALKRRGTGRRQSYDL